MTRWLVTGAGGMLGRDVVAALAGESMHAPTRRELDLLDGPAVAEAVAGADVVVNCAAWTDVDAAETREDEATRVNGTAVGLLAAACARSGARLLHPSTDYVFAGDATAPYAEDAPTDPVNAYGRSKLAGEREVLTRLPDDGFVVRTAWLYGLHGRSFVATMTRLAAGEDPVEVVDDQVGQPTWSADLADRLVRLGRAQDAPAGVYHGTSSGTTSWHGLARDVFRLVGADPDRVIRTTSDRFTRPARRPAYSVLGHARWSLAGLPEMRHWRTGLEAWAVARAAARHAAD